MFISSAPFTAKRGRIICSLRNAGKIYPLQQLFVGVCWGKSGRFKFYSAGHSEQIMLAAK
jgi:hypothetical protein